MVRRLLLLVGALIILGVLFAVLRPKSATAPPTHRTVALIIHGTSMKPAGITVHEGDTVTFRATSDHAVELHLHGYDRKLHVPAGDNRHPASLSFTATLTGSFTIEDEPTSTELGTLTVQPRA